MNLDLLLILIFYSILLLLFFRYRKKFDVQNKIFVLYRTKLGIKLMDKISKTYPNFIRYLGYSGVIIGFLGMFFIFYVLIQATVKLIFVPKALPAVAPVLPGISIPGLPALSFWHWIIAIFVVATIHEFSHGVYARLVNVKVKSSGFAFLGPILAAFVEPDEKQTAKKTRMQQLSIFAAGPYSNILLGIIIFAIVVLLISPVTSSLIELRGVQIVGTQEGFPAQKANLTQGEKIIFINKQEVKDVDSFTQIMQFIKPGDTITIKTNQKEVSLKTVKNPENKTKAFIGIQVMPQERVVKESIALKYGTVLPKTFLWFTQLLFWIYVISLGIGLFNLLPLGPVDGGRMFLTGLGFIIKDDKKIKKIWTQVSIFVLLLIVINFLPWLFKLFKFIFTPLVGLFG